MSFKLFSEYTSTSFTSGLIVQARLHEVGCVGPLMLDIKGVILIVRPGLCISIR